MESAPARVRKINLYGKRLLIPMMHPFGAPLLAACFRAFGVDAVVMDTYKGLFLGKEYTSSKECFPCQITLGDVLFFLKHEKQRLGEEFRACDYVYFMPESDGPCRFGMYNKMQRIVLDTIAEFKDINVSYLSTEDSYDCGEILPLRDAGEFKKLAYLASIVGDVLDRIVLRARPYERKKGSTDRLASASLDRIISIIEEEGRNIPLSLLLEEVSRTAREAASLMDTLERRPQIGIVGEIYVRSHPWSNEHLIRKIEAYGGEVTNATVGEWLNFVSFENFRKLKREIEKQVREARWISLFSLWKGWLSHFLERYYQRQKQRQIYEAALAYLDIHPDHPVEELREILEREGLYSFEVGTEACLSIAGAIKYIEEGFDGIINVFPFTCMPSTICSAILRPVLRERRIPYLDSPHDGTIQPGRELALRTFMYQALLRCKSKKGGRG